MICSGSKQRSTRISNQTSSFISDIARYVLSSGGKRIRPVLLILSARLCNYVGERIYDLSAVIEFIHTATLLHDDVIDNSQLRRGHPTVNSRWGNEISILIGDYLYSKAMSLSLADKDHLVMQTISASQWKWRRAR